MSHLVKLVSTIKTPERKRDTQLTSVVVYPKTDKQTVGQTDTNRLTDKKDRHIETILILEK